MSMQPDSRSKSLEEASTDPHGTDLILQILQKQGTPVTRESYLALSIPDANPAEFQGAEIEADLPPDLRFRPHGAASSEPQP